MRRNPRTRRISEHVHGYRTAHEFLGNKDRRKLASNTWVERGGDGSIGVVLHKTTIVRYYQDGSLTLNSGGYRSKTTKQRINQLLPAGLGLSQKDYEWTVIGFGQRVPFEDGMVISSPGIREFNFIGSEREEESEDDEDYQENPGKFNNDLDHAMYLLSLEATDDDFGDSSDGGGWYGLMIDVGREDFGKPSPTVARQMRADEIEFPIHAIIHERTDGIIEVSYFDSKKDAEEEWEAESQAYFNEFGEE